MHAYRALHTYVVHVHAAHAHTAQTHVLYAHALHIHALHSRSYVISASDMPTAAVIDKRFCVD